MKRRNTRQRAQERYVYQLMRRFGMTLEDYVRLGVRQKWRCRICDRSREELQQDLVVDHNHKTGKVRGLLCKGCNQALGLLHDEVEWIQRAIDYLTSAS